MRVDGNPPAALARTSRHRSRYPFELVTKQTSEDPRRGVQVRMAASIRARQDARGRGETGLSSERHGEVQRLSHLDRLTKRAIARGLEGERARQVLEARLQATPLPIEDRLSSSQRAAGMRRLGGASSPHALGAQAHRCLARRGPAGWSNYRPRTSPMNRSTLRHRTAAETDPRWVGSSRASARTQDRTHREDVV